MQIDDRLPAFCDEYQTYPKNLVRHQHYSHNLLAYHQRLLLQRDKLFDEARASVDFLDLKVGQQEFQPHTVSTLQSLRLLLKESSIPDGGDPLCRFVFLRTPHSRAPLRISHDMLSLLFTYHQVMASFLNFVFPFGKQVYAKEIHFSGFREEFQLAANQQTNAVLGLSRSGTGLRLCYNLRSVERSQDAGKLPWSIRQAALYHEFDIKSGRALWVVVKGNKLIKERIMKECTPSFTAQTNFPNDAFSASLGPHLLLCDWSSENWRWYINDIEDQVQDLTRGLLAMPVDVQRGPVSVPVVPVSSLKDSRSQSSSLARFWVIADQMFIAYHAVTRRFFSQSSSNSCQQPNPQGRQETIAEVHTFSDLQRIQYFEEKAQEALLVLKLNAEVLLELRGHYKYATTQVGFPTGLKTHCQTDLLRFDKDISGTEDELRILGARTDTLLGLLANSKSLLSSILQHRSVKQAQASADQMERMTADMHDLAKKTKQEAVSMRVITSVTLFFLPATFIATFMSTDILKFEQDESKFQGNGLRLYLAIVLPLTLLTFFAWYMIYVFARRRDSSSD